MPYLKTPQYATPLGAAQADRLRQQQQQFMMYGAGSNDAPLNWMDWIKAHWMAILIALIILIIVIVLLVKKCNAANLKERYNFY